MVSPKPAELSRRRWGLACAAAGATLLTPELALALSAKGKVTGYEFLLNPVWEEAKTPDHHGYSFREPVPTVEARYRRLFPHIPKELCIAALGTATYERKPLLVRVGGGRTTPVTVVVPPKTELQFKHTDPFTHRLYGVGIKSFSVADTTGKGGIRKWQVPDKGTFEIRDELAPSLRMWVIADPSVAAISYPDLKGNYILTVPEAGDYKVQVYFAGKPVGTPQPIQLSRRDVAVPPIVVATKKSAAEAEAKKKAEKAKSEKK